ncbi:hypothetical protein C0995_015594 [Termitomyces sp. Mi166|nr:hypothetical protein C0995_015594 [Termitomyces sp. Mi166\
MTSTLPPLVQAFSGAIGSASANILTYPLDLLTTRVQLDPPGKNRKHRRIGGALRLLRNIAHRDGIAALYGGVWSDTGATILSRLQAEETTDEDSDEKNEIESPRNKGIVGAAQRIYKEHGLIGFWRGFQTTVILSLNPSITLAFFQLFRRLLSLFQRKSRFDNKRSMSGQADPTPGQAFFGAAISNSIAVCALYPLILAKTRLQASSATSFREVINNAYNGVDTYSHKHRGTQTQDTIVGVSGLYQVKGRIEEMIINAYLRRRRRT